jgi:hypothetical protein
VVEGYRCGKAGTQPAIQCRNPFLAVVFPGIFPVLPHPFENFRFEIFCVNELYRFFEAAAHQRFGNIFLT